MYFEKKYLALSFCLPVADRCGELYKVVVNNVFLAPKGGTMVDGNVDVWGAMGSPSGG